MRDMTFLALLPSDKSKDDAYDEEEQRKRERE